jgi:hypothetical protein
MRWSTSRGWRMRRERKKARHTRRWRAFGGRRHPANFACLWVWWAGGWSERVDHSARVSSGGLGHGRANAQAAQRLGAAGDTPSTVRNCPFGTPWHRRRSRSQCSAQFSSVAKCEICRVCVRVYTTQHSQWLWLLCAFIKKIPDFSKRSPAHTLSHAGHTPNTRCTPILSLSPYSPPYQPLWLVSWGGVPPTAYLQTRSPHPKGGSHDERTKTMPYLSFSGGAAVCTSSASRGGLVTGCYEVACRPLGHLLTKRCRIGDPIRLLFGFCFCFVFVLFFFRTGHVLARATRQDIGHGRAARPALWSLAGPEMMRAVGPAPGRTAR